MNQEQLQELQAQQAFPLAPGPFIPGEGIAYPGFNGMTMRQFYKTFAPSPPSWWEELLPATQHPDYPKRGKDQHWCEGCKMGGECNGNRNCAELRKLQQDQKEFVVRYDIRRRVEWAAAWADRMVVEDEIGAEQ